MNVYDIVKNSIDSIVGDLNEAYVTEPKKFDLKTELLSDKTKTNIIEDFENSVDCLNEVSAKLDGTDRIEVNNKHSEYRSLKLDEVFNYNYSFLKAQHLENISDLNSKINMDMLAYMRLNRDFGTFDEWQKDFIACCMASRNGFSICGYSLKLKRYINFFVDGHDLALPLEVIPVVVLDVSELAYVKDYLIDKKLYVHAMMKEFNWQTIEERFTRAEKIAKII